MHYLTSHIRTSTSRLQESSTQGKREEVNGSKMLGQETLGERPSRLSPGDNEAKAQGTVTSPHRNPCSYLISEPQSTLAHRHHLVPMPATKNNCEDSQQLHLLEEDILTLPRQTQVSNSVTCQVIPASVRTRSSREVIKPKRLDR